MRVSRRAWIFAVGALAVVGIGGAALLRFDSDADVAEIDAARKAQPTAAGDGPAPLEGPAAQHDPLPNEPKPDRPAVDNETLREGDMAQLAGIVRDHSTGAPIAGALVVARVEDGNATRTDEHGEYRIDLRFKLGLLEAYAPGYLPEVWRYPDGPKGAHMEVLDPLPARHDFSLVKNPLGTDLTVICKRPDGSTAGGSPVTVRLRATTLADARVDVSAKEQVEFATRTSRLFKHGVVVTRVDDPRSTRLDVDGTARYALPVPGRYDVLVRDSGLVASERVSVEGGERTVELKLTPGVALPVKVIRDGAPVPTAKVEIWSARWEIPDTAIAGDDGIATFTGLAAGMPVVLRCGPERTGASRPLEVPAVSPKDPILLELPPAAGMSFDFTVVELETGRPVRDGRVRFGDLPAIECREHGRFKAAVPVRPTDIVSIEAPGRRSRILTAAGVLAAGASISLDGFRKLGTRVRFRAVDAGGAPQAGARIEAHAVLYTGDGLSITNLELDGPSFTGPDGFCGEIAVDLRSGEHLEVYAERAGSDDSRAGVLRGHAVRVEPGQDLIVALDGAVTRIRGRVTISGKPTDGERVRLLVTRPRDAAVALTEDQPEHEAAECLDDGSFVLDVSPGPVTITAMSGHLAAAVTVEATPDTEAVANLDLAPARAVRVDVVDSVTKGPIANAIYSADAEVDAVGAVFRVPRGGSVHSLVRARGYAPAELHLRDEDRPTEVRLEMRRLP